MSRVLNPEKKYEAVLEVLARKEPLRVIARRYGVSEPTLRCAKEQFLSGAKSALNSKDNKSHTNEINSLEKQIAQRDQLIGEYTVANRILKKKVDGYL